MDTHDGTLRYVYVFLILGLYKQKCYSYDFKCPEQSTWILKAYTTCGNVLEYFCLLDYNVNMYKDFCTRKPDITRHITWKKGQKCVLRGSLDGENCTARRYQPFKFRTDGNSDCVYKKSLCTGEGMIIYKNGSTTSDTLCRCDYTKGFAFVSKTKESCYCIPSVEDCSCYKKECQMNFEISPDYNCTSIYTTEKQSICPEIDMRQLVNGETQMHEVNKEKTDVSPSENMNTFKIMMIGGSKDAVLIVLVLTGICVIIVFAYIERREVMDFFRNLFFLDMMNTSIGQRTHLLRESDDSKDHEEKENIIKYKKNEDSKSLYAYDTVTNSWKKDDNTFTVTRSTIEIEKILREKNCVLVVGCSGNGKSTTIRNIALKFCNNEGYAIIPNVEDPTTILQNYNPDRNQLFVIDDFCGEVVTNAQKVVMWSLQMDDILKLTKNNQEQTDRQARKGNVKLIFATIPAIFEDTVFRRIDCLSEYTFDLSSLPLQDEEKDEMFQKYCTEEKMSYKFISTFKCHEGMFPLLCKLSKRKPEEQIVNLFRNHKSFIKEDFQAQTNQEQICLMALCFLFESLNEAVFCENNSNKRDKLLLETVCSELDLKYDSIRLKLKNELKNLDDTYFIKYGNSYNFVHQEVYDIAAVYCSNLIKNSVIMFAPCSVIAERCSFVSTDIDEGEPYIHIADDSEKTFFDRLMHDLKQRITYSTFHNSQLTKASYRKAFCYYCQKRKPKLVELLNRLQQRSADPFDNPIDITTDASECNVDEYEDYLQFTKSYHFASHKMKIPLIESAWEGNTDIVNLLLEIECNVNVTDKFGRSSLFVACHLGKADVVELLLEKGADPSLCDAYDTSPLHAACKGGHSKIVDNLLAMGIDASKRDNKGRSPLHVASEAGHKTIAETLLAEKYSVDISNCDNCDRSVLFYAAYKGKKNVVKFLIDKKADINKCDDKGCSPLMAASSAGMLGAVTTLLNAKAEINTINTDGQSALVLACEKGHETIVKVLLESGADVMQYDWHNQSPLCIASTLGNANIVSLLVDYKVDISYTDDLSRSALFMACEKGHGKVVDILLEKAQLLDIRHADKRLCSPLYVACKGGFIEIVKKLVCKGAKLNQCNVWLSTPLSVASREGYTEVVEYLIDKNAKVNTVDSSGCTPLSLACDRGHFKIVKVLVEKGSNINHRDNTKRTPLEIAQARRHANIADFLKRTCK